jgi:hypothetical protein
MRNFVEQIVDANLADRIFSERQLAEILGGSDASRYGLVNRALKDGSLIRLKRGTYALDKRNRNESVHPFGAAQALLPGSCVTFETALAYHGWIPEAVYTVASVTPGRKTITRNTPDFGQFTFHPLAIHDYQFMTSVAREKLGSLTAFIAEPLRALMDLVALRKTQWSGLDWLTVGMRIDQDHLLSLRRKDFSALKSVYKHKAVNEFLHSFESSILSAKAVARSRSSYD